ncbi:MAG: hypothetical protein L6Q71_12145 [Planctomycetes bacterium]|nr:hypothetical protein [Planctomycetota bacterium]NUQ35411.1 hypothetical protein [Planctomycetaceae bacterium]
MANEQIHIEANDKVITRYDGDSDTVNRIIKGQKKIELARIANEWELSRRPRKLVEGIVYLFSKGGARDARRMEIEHELANLNIQCRAFRQAVKALLDSEKEKTRRFEALCSALPSMNPEARDVALDILNRLAAVTDSLPAPASPNMPGLPERKGI